MTQKDITKFQKTVLDFYAEHKRDLPWRPHKKRTVIPYEIMVSEYMLQQTQVDRVVPKFLLFIKKFPTMQKLADSKDKELISAWSGLGYNRRAFYLRSTCQLLIKDYKGVISKDPKILKTFPGIGEYMSSILPVFIYNQRNILIETNIRSVYLHYFFKGKDSVTDKEILTLIEETLPYGNLRDWYYALMDYGTYLKKEKKMKNTQSTHYTKQKPFKGSLRFVRGTLLKKLLIKKIEKSSVYDIFPDYTSAQIEKVCLDLLQEGLIKETKKFFFI